MYECPPPLSCAREEETNISQLCVQTCQSCCERNGWGKLREQEFVNSVVDYLQCLVAVTGVKIDTRPQLGDNFIQLLVQMPQLEAAGLGPLLDHHHNMAAK